MSLDLQSIQAVIMDMDGVLWRGDHGLPAVAEFITFVQERRLPLALATNNSSRHPTEFITKLDKLGVTGIHENSIVTSGTATADYLRQEYGLNPYVYLIGMPGLARVLEESGITVILDTPPPGAMVKMKVDAVVVGIDFEFTYEKARFATHLIRAGVPFVATNPDTSFPTPTGLAPGAGSIVQMIAAASDKPPVIIGKPASEMFMIAMKRINAPSVVTTLMIGDRLNTDIEGAQAMGMPATLVMTGVTSPSDLMQSAIMPEMVCIDLADLLARWRG